MRRWLVAALVIVLAFPSAASAWSVLTFARGFNGVDGFLRTAGFTGREFVRVYHSEGRSWAVFYEDQNGNNFGVAVDNANPTVQTNNASYAMAWCQNINDNSFVEFTCQTTQP
jgi:hypothetical protein